MNTLFIPPQPTTNDPSDAWDPSLLAEEIEPLQVLIHQLIQTLPKRKQTTSYGHLETIQGLVREISIWGQDSTELREALDETLENYVVFLPDPFNKEKSLYCGDNLTNVILPEQFELEGTCKLADWPECPYLPNREWLNEHSSSQYNEVNIAIEKNNDDLNIQISGPAKPFLTSLQIGEVFGSTGTEPLLQLLN